ncbi:GNAT family N-acetyltransferase [Burkholderia cenocepacia]|uniref:GNAT family N-acetyltransferase n=1 Tax=Burkholderia cenocepacia TaxID=95486 RepID=UPI0020A0A314|nr:GNAT family N-acetyltransferase [Burkholderia cenocepacia]MCO8321126.1 GNAT family N-acetyltransferase [Burkholderia cenocepacia]MCO8328614.1 GNAT family N-acetyltransferase [Burkholderia cenocepacia]MCO8335900.1 GNAT family N-acetyltransferase [Burkholderia cenocepacia]MCO8342981.1 GNAT family N-acetyltransferase [Burkholderia cenocepacia]MCO8356263.1 GNAT family N-acetyltransferase [Burkholderia cenocepacia]
MNISIRNATLNDVSFLVQQFDEGVAGGHFAGQPHVTTARVWQEWLTKHHIFREIYRPNGTHAFEAIPITVWIADRGGEAIGWLVSSPEFPNDKSSIEIYMMGVKKSARRQGVASSLVQHAESQYDAATKFYARCYPKSTWAIKFLEKNGYRIERISQNSRVHYLRKP